MATGITYNLTNMADNKPGVTETNDFSYYTQLLNQDVPVIFTGDINKLLTLWREITDFLRETHDINMCLCETSPDKMKYNG